MKLVKPLLVVFSLGFLFLVGCSSGSKSLKPVVAEQVNIPEGNNTNLNNTEETTNKEVITTATVTVQFTGNGFPHLTVLPFDRAVDLQWTISGATHCKLFEFPIGASYQTESLNLSSIEANSIAISSTASITGGVRKPFYPHPGVVFLVGCENRSVSLPYPRTFASLQVNSAIAPSVSNFSVKFNGNAAFSVAKGSSLSLSYTAVGVGECSIFDGATLIRNGGLSVTDFPYVVNATANLKLHCYDLLGKVVASSDSITVVVNDIGTPPPAGTVPVLNVFSGPTISSLNYGAQALLTWSVSNATTCTLKQIDSFNTFTLSATAISGSLSTAALLGGRIQFNLRCTKAGSDAVLDEDLFVSVLEPMDHILFASRFTTPGSITEGNSFGLAAADAKCQKWAHAAGLRKDRTWKALMAATQSPANSYSRIQIFGAVYNQRGSQIVSGEKFWTGNANVRANDWPSSVQYDEYGSSHSGYVWTGMDPNGTQVPYDCKNWASSAHSDYGRTGDPLASDVRRFDKGSPERCDLPRHLYCISQ